MTTPWREWNDLVVPLAGQHQIRNAALAVAALDVLNRRSDCSIRQTDATAGLATVHCPVRIEVVSDNPTVIIDAAHNEASCEALVDTLGANFAQRPRTLVFAATGGKNVPAMLDVLLPEFERTVLTQYGGNPRFVPVEDLARLAGRRNADRTHVTTNVDAAWALARELTPNTGIICVTGSFFIAAEMRELVTGVMGSQGRKSSTT